MSNINTFLSSTGVYATKAISAIAKASNGRVFDLSIGEPEFGPPPHMLDQISSSLLTRENFYESVKRYEQSRGASELRHAIAAWYDRRYGLKVDPETEILVTHGGVEAITLALLSCTNTGDGVVVTDPAYMLYEKTITTHGRRPRRFERVVAEEEYSELLNTNSEFRSELGNAAAIIVNSPENPSGYVLTKGEWKELLRVAEQNNTWLIHDEVYDTMSFDRSHLPARTLDDGGHRTIMINSCSKKFGTPGLRIGWMVANKNVIDAACKAHDYLYLGVNILYERVASAFLNDSKLDGWLAETTSMLQARSEQAQTMLSEIQGFLWDRRPHGAMFLFPNVAGVYDRLPERYRTAGQDIGEVVANYLIRERDVATVPGNVYGQNGRARIRMVTCSPEKIFNGAMDRLASLKAEAAA